MNRILVLACSVVLVTCVSCARTTTSTDESTGEAGIPDAAPVETPPATAGTEVVPPPAPPKPVDTSGSTGTGGYSAQCGSNVMNLGNIVGPAITTMLTRGNPQPTGKPATYPQTDKSKPEPGIRYDRNNGPALQDCSGNFLRLASLVAAKCPNLELPIQAGVPPYTKGTDGKSVGADLLRGVPRDTGATARWYHEKRLFTPVYCDGKYTNFSADLKAVEKLIQPGAVIWYADGESCTTKDQDIDELFSTINHMGTVQSVERNASGEVTSYVIYHGRNNGKGSGLNTLLRKYKDGTKVPPFGNWTEPVVGIAPIVPVTQGP